MFRNIIQQELERWWKLTESYSRKVLSMWKNGNGFAILKVFICFNSLLYSSMLHHKDFTQIYYKYSETIKILKSIYRSI